MKDHPHLISLYNIYQNEVQSFRKVHRMIDLFESIIKSHTIVILGEYVRYNKLSDAAKGMLAQGLRTPSLGTWQLFSRVLFEELQAEDQFSWSFSEFPVEFSALDKCLNIEKTNIIAFRNSYAHGATPTDSQCLADIQKFEPFLNILLKSNWITTTRIETRESKVRIIGDSGEVCVHPILVHKSDGGDTPYAFFNDLKNDKVGLLNYPLSKHYREKDFLNEFHEYLPINEWKKSGNNEFYQRIDELTETFKGRTNERKKLLNFVSENNKGYCSIQGNPGIGKSALIAQFFKDLRAQKEVTNVHVVEYFIRRGTIQSQIEYMFNYLIRRTDEIFIQGKEIRAEGKDIWDLQQQLFAKWRLWGEQCAGKKLLFLIDGLDEGTENNIVKYLPRENFLGVLIIYGSRPGGHTSLEELWSQLPTENHTKLELSGLSLEDIRALIYEVANKYELERESAWIDAVQKRSQGNPLYLKLLCDAIENGSIELNDIHALPEKIDEYYKAILARYAADTLDGDALLAGLYTFAAARDYLTLAHIKFINKLGDATVQRIGSTLKEVLYENPLTETVLDYQLFHESFREYLVKEKAREVSDAAERIIEFCSTWQDHEGNWELRYCLQHYAAHAAVSSRKARASELLMLLGNTEYIEIQKKVLKHFNSTKELFQLCLLKASELKLYDRQLDAALCLIDLKYEEANDAPEVVALVASGNPDDLELALKRIESFGGTDIEGVRRRFILYMLCLMELTLLGSKDAPFRKDTIDKLLKHLDEQIPVDNSIINWNEFFPSYTMFLMACEWAELELDYLIIYKRTSEWEYKCLNQNGPYTDFQFDVLYKLLSIFEKDFDKINALKEISSELIKQGKLEEAGSFIGQAIKYYQSISNWYDKRIAHKEIVSVLTKLCKIEQALDFAGKIFDDDDKSFAIKEIISELAKQGKIENAHEYSTSISVAYDKSLTLNNISSELAKQGKFEEAGYILDQAIESYRCITDEEVYQKKIALSEISIELAKQGKVEQALEYSLSISDSYDKSRALTSISSELFKQGKLEVAASIMVEVLECVRGIRNDRNSRVLRLISSELAKQGKLEQALEFAHSIFDEFQKSYALNDIANEFAKQGEMVQALEISHIIFRVVIKSLALCGISRELAKQGKTIEAASVMEQALQCARTISRDKDRNIALTEISGELFKQGKTEAAIVCAQGISIQRHKNSALKSITTELAKHRKVDELATSLVRTLNCQRGLFIESNKKNSLMIISSELSKKGKIEEALECVRNISKEFLNVKIEEDTATEFLKSRALKSISCELFKQSKFKEAGTIMEQALECVRVDKSYISSTHLYYAVIKSKSYDTLIEIIIELAKQGYIEQAITCALNISHEYQKSIALMNISSELVKHGMIEESVSIMEQAIKCAQSIINKSRRYKALMHIASELALQGKIEQALVCALDISNDHQKCKALINISKELAKHRNIKDAESILEQALEFARSITEANDKSHGLIGISSQLAKHGRTEKSTIVLEQAIECARNISDNYNKSGALKDISSELIKQSNWEFAEKIGFEITQLAVRQSCWKTIAEVNYKEVGWQKSLQQVTCFKNDEARMFYLKGWVEAVDLYEVNSDCVKEALSIIANDSESIETLLQKHALHEVFLSNTNTEKINQLNHSLNIQWMLDIANQFPNSNNKTRLSTNVETWLHEIADEDDRERVELWAMKVAKGTMNEEEFKLKLEKISFI